MQSVLSVPLPNYQGPTKTITTLPTALGHVPRDPLSRPDLKPTVHLHKVLPRPTQDHQGQLLFQSSLKALPVSCSQSRLQNQCIPSFWQPYRTGCVMSPWLQRLRRRGGICSRSHSQARSVELDCSGLLLQEPQSRSSTLGI